MTDYNQQYKNHENVFGKESERMLQEYYSHLNKEHPVLDIGSGQGRNSFFLAEKGFDVIALDPSEVATDLVAYQAQRFGLSIKSVTKSFISYPATEAPFSAILIFGLIQILSWSEIQLLIANIEQWTQPGSLVFITTFSTKDATFKKYKSAFKELTENSFQKENGDIRTFLNPVQILELFAGHEIVHHWEGQGPEHHHGDGRMEQHAMIEAIFRKS